MDTQPVLSLFEKKTLTVNVEQSRWGFPIQEATQKILALGMLLISVLVASGFYSLTAVFIPGMNEFWQNIIVGFYIVAMVSVAGLVWNRAVKFFTKRQRYWQDKNSEIFVQAVADAGYVIPKHTELTSAHREKFVDKVTGVPYRVGGYSHNQRELFVELKP